MRDSFIISRALWLHGEGHRESLLLRGRDNKQCCLGIYLEHCGVAKEKLLHITEPSGLFQKIGNEYPDQAKWLLKKGQEVVVNSNVTYDLALVNDSSLYEEEEREKEITQLFFEHAIDVTFTD